MQCPMDPISDQPSAHLIDSVNPPLTPIAKIQPVMIQEAVDLPPIYVDRKNVDAVLNCASYIDGMGSTDSFIAYWPSRGVMHARLNKLERELSIEINF